MLLLLGLEVGVRYLQGSGGCGCLTAGIWVMGGMECKGLLGPSVTAGSGGE